MNYDSLKEDQDSELTARCRNSAIYKKNHLYSAERALAVEEPLEIFVNGRLYETTMRSPGDDLNLVAGFCYTDGVISDWGDVKSLNNAKGAEGRSQVFVEVRTPHNPQTEASSRPVSADRGGECLQPAGAPENVVREKKDSVPCFTPVVIDDLFESNRAFKAKQGLFSLTGCTHACAVFDQDQVMLSFAEDVGRHNALDKAVGVLVRAGRQGESYVVLISSRLGAEIVRKASPLGIEILAGMSAPTDRAVDMALKLNLTLIGFLRADSMTIYTYAQRVTVS